MEKMKKLLLFGLAAFLVNACGSGVKVTSDQAEGVDFNKYKTFSFLGWQKDSDKLMNDFDKKRIHNSFIDEFKRRGLTFVESGGDAAVALYFVVDQETSVTGYTNYYGGGGYGRYGRYGGGWGAGAGASTTTYTESDYFVGTLVMDVFDEGTGEQIWQGIANGTIEEDPQKREKSIPKSISALMSKYPVKPLSN
jgi:hypothetical protein